MIFVCNTGPLIALAKLNRLVLLQHLGGTSVFIPPMVHKELWSKIGPKTPLIETALRTFIHISNSNFENQLVSTCDSSSRPRIMKSLKCPQLSKTM